MMDAMEIAIPVILSGVFSFLFGKYTGRKSCADEAIKPNPETWWRIALIESRARASVRAEALERR